MLSDRISTESHELLENGLKNLEVSIMEMKELSKGDEAI
jgi:hypothetical protein